MKLTRIFFKSNSYILTFIRFLIIYILFKYIVPILSTRFLLYILPSSQVDTILPSFFFFSTIFLGLIEFFCHVKFTFNIVHFKILKSLVIYVSVNVILGTIVGIIDRFILGTCSTSLIDRQALMNCQKQPYPFILLCVLLVSIFLTFYFYKRLVFSKVKGK